MNTANGFSFVRSLQSVWSSEEENEEEKKKHDDKKRMVDVFSIDQP